MDKLKRATFLACVAMAAPNVALAGTGWAGIGGATAAPDAANLMIAARGDPKHREIMFCVEGHLMRLTDAVLHFQDGSTQSVRVNERLTAGGCSRGKTLSGRNRTVQKAVVSYDQASLAGGSARVELFVR